MKGIMEFIELRIRRYSLISLLNKKSSTIVLA